MSVYLVLVALWEAIKAEQAGNNASIRFASSIWLFSLSALFYPNCLYWHDKPDEHRKADEAATKAGLSNLPRLSCNDNLADQLGLWIWRSIPVLYSYSSLLRVRAIHASNMLSINSVMEILSQRPFITAPMVPMLLACQCRYQPVAQSNGGHSGCGEG